MRRFLYTLARILSDLNAAHKGKVARRVARRSAGRASGRAIGKLFRRR